MALIKADKLAGVRVHLRIRNIVAACSCAKSAPARERAKSTASSFKKDELSAGLLECVRAAWLCVRVFARVFVCEGIGDASCTSRSLFRMSPPGADARPEQAETVATRGWSERREGGARGEACVHFGG
eukprot:6176232-Pleurochrysis_carterae.AAC.3